MTDYRGGRKPTKYNDPQYRKLVRFFGFIDVATLISEFN